MVKLNLIIAFFLVALKSQAQTPVEWELSYDKNVSSISFVAKIDEGWHIYSQYIDESAGPVATSFHFTDSKDLKVKGKTIEPTPIEEYDPNFEATLLFFEKEAVFSQEIKLKKSTTLKGSVTYMVCNETMCLPPVDVPFELKLEK